MPLNQGLFDLVRTVRFNQQPVSPTAPATGKSLLYFKSDGKLYTMSSSGQEVEIAVEKAAEEPADIVVGGIVKTFSFRAVLTWSDSDAAREIGGEDTDLMEDGYVILTTISRCATEVGDGIQNITLGDGSTADRYITSVTPTVVPIIHTLANRISDGTNKKLVVTPASTATMEIEIIVQGIVMGVEA